MNLSPEPPKTIFPLHAITGRLKELMAEVESKRFWVQAQFIPDQSSKRRGGHCYGSLVEDDGSGQRLAHMRAVIWHSYRQRIEQKLREAGCEQSLNERQEICALASIRFHPVYGLKLEISDVDPTMGVSLLEKNRHEVLEKLRTADLLHRNRGISLREASLRIGLITSPGSAAYADFTQTLLRSGFAFRIVLAPATMQGETSPSQVVRAIRQLEQQDIDVICLVRGGGSPMDLASFDCLAIGEAVANCPKPVWVGIGHEIDVTVPDFVAHTSHKTPTAVAEALVARLEDLDARLQTARNRLADVCQRTLLLAGRDLDRNGNGLRQGLRKHIQLHQTRFQGLEDRIRRSIRNRLSGNQSRLDYVQVRLQERIGRVLAGKGQTLNQSLLALSRGAATRLATTSKDIFHYIKRLRKMPQFVEQRLARVDEWQRYLDAVSPERVFARGYSLTRDAQGKVIRDVSQVEPGEFIHTQLSQGNITSKVENTQDQKNDQDESGQTDLRAKGKTIGGNLGAVGSLRDANG